MQVIKSVLPSPWLIALISIQVLFLAVAFFNGSLPFAALSRDPLAAAKDYGPCCSYFYGALSSIGVLLWFGTAAVLAFAAMICMKRHSRIATQHLALMAFVCVMLGFDDLFMLHEAFLPGYGVPEKVVVGVYGVIAAFAVVWTGETMLSRRNRASLLLAGAFLGFSVRVDLLHQSGGALHYLLEDGSKFLGIGAWAHYNISAALKLASETPEGATQAEADAAAVQSAAL